LACRALIASFNRYLLDLATTVPVPALPVPLHLCASVLLPYDIQHGVVGLASRALLASGPELSLHVR